MHQSVVRLMTFASLLLGLGAFTPVSASAASAGGNKTLIETALRIVSGIHGPWPQMPDKIVTWQMMRVSIEVPRASSVSLISAATQLTSLFRSPMTLHLRRYAASIATSGDSRSALTCRIGGWPKDRLYSRLNWLTLSYPTSYAAQVASRPSNSIRCALAGDGGFTIH